MNVESTYQDAGMTLAAALIEANWAEFAWDLYCVTEVYTSGALTLDQFRDYVAYDYGILERCNRRLTRQATRCA